ncbi:hypothetical protein [Sphingobium sp.]|uniref:hypothetical protein n=1 Tax=Sphingobium sp. TaxID=1912891 RepID=UPI0028BF0162|nr:hypothetical protein [Sphingobium sp.]
MVAFDPDILAALATGKGTIMPHPPQTSPSQTGFPRSGRADGARAYSVSLLQAAAALYGVEVAQLLDGANKPPKSNRKFRE